MNLPTYKGKQLIPFSPINPLSLSSTASPTSPSASASVSTANANGRCPKGHIDDENTVAIRIDAPEIENVTNELNSSINSSQNIPDVTQTRAGTVFVSRKTSKG